MEEAWELAALVMASRHIPNELKRQLLEEAGYRCAVPTCNETSALQFEHIEDWAKLEKQEHDFDKMIVLCATCHARVTSKEIPKDAIRAYKRNLALVLGRYSHFEVRLLGRYWEGGLRDEGDSLRVQGGIPAMFNETQTLHIEGLVRDGLFIVQPMPIKANQDPKIRKMLSEGLEDSNVEFYARCQGLTQYSVRPTPKAIEFIKNYFSGNEVK